MRFAAVNLARQTQREQPQRSAFAEMISRWVGACQPTRAPAAAPATQELPADLDQRVRLIGEW